MRRLALTAIYASLLLLAAGSVAWGLMRLARGPAPSGPVQAAAQRYSYDIVRWHIYAVPQKLASWLGELRPGARRQSDDDVLIAFFARLRELRALETTGADLPSSLRYARAEALRRELKDMENDVERVLERRLTAVLREQGITLRPPLFQGVELVFPPVAVELDAPPKVLAISPRDHIELTAAYLLQPDLGELERDAIEDRASALGMAALVADVGALGSYPSAVPPLLDYQALMETVAHEWVHQYLALFPLGRHYFRDDETRTLNETVANIAGRELGRLIVQRYPLPLPTASQAPSPQVASELRQLRLDVESLLARGQVKEAEQLMEAKRRELAARGFYIRKINQAYFAFYGLYADSPVSTSSVGPKLTRLREESGSLARFLSRAAGITSVQELDTLLASSR